MEYWKLVPADRTELEGPYECPFCGGHVMLDTTFLDQVKLETTCPYCKKEVTLSEEE